MSIKKVYSHADGVRLARYRDEFEHASVTGKWKQTYKPSAEGWKESGRVYVIYSYGSHFPMYVYDEESGEWIGNKDKYSRTTSTHQSKYRPSEVAKWFNTTGTMEVVLYGLVGHITNRMEKGAGILV